MWQNLVQHVEIQKYHRETRVRRAIYFPVVLFHDSDVQTVLKLTKQTSCLKQGCKHHK